MRKASKRILAVITSAALTLSMLASTMTAFAAEPAAGDSTVVTIFHTNDMHGSVENLSYVKNLKNKTANSILVDGGDATQGTSLATYTKGSAIIELLNEAGYDGMTLGNHEFDYGSEVTVSNAELAEFPVVSANTFKADGSNLLDGINGGNGEYFIVEEAGYKFGFFGLTTVETAYKTNPQKLNGVTFADEIETAKSMVTELEEAGADYIIALAHVGIDESTITTSHKIADSVEGIDLIIDGHSHSEDTYVSETTGTVVAQTGTKLGNIGKVTFEISADSKTEIKAELIPTIYYTVLLGDVDNDNAATMVDVVLTQQYIAEMIDFTDEQKYRADVAVDYGTVDMADVIAMQKYNAEIIKSYPAEADLGIISNKPDSDYADKYNAKNEELKPILSEVVASSSTPIFTFADGSIRVTRMEETPAGSLVADAMKYAAEEMIYSMGVDYPVVALQNGGGVRADLPAGNITVGDIFNVLPFGNTIQVVKISPAELYRTLENGVAGLKYDEETGYQVNAYAALSVVAGMEVYADLSKQAQVVTDGVVTTEGERVVEVYLVNNDGTKTLLDKNDTETTIALVSNDFELSGGDNYVTLAALDRIVEGGPLDVALQDYIKNVLADELTGEFTYASTSGRMNYVQQPYDSTVNVTLDVALEAGLEYEISVDGGESFIVTADENGLITLEGVDFGAHTVKIADSFYFVSTVTGIHVKSYEVVTKVYNVAGDTGLTGIHWDPTQNPMTTEDGEIYTITFTNVPQGTYGFKIVEDGSWDNPSYGDGDGNYIISLIADGDVTITFNSKTGEITVDGDTIGEIENHTYSIAGDANLVGEDWNPANTETTMTLNEETGLYEFTFENVIDGAYEFKVVQDYAWTVSYPGPITNAQVEVEVEGSTVKIFFNPETKEISTEVIPPVADTETEIDTTTETETETESDTEIIYNVKDAAALESKTSADVKGQIVYKYVGSDGSYLVIEEVIDGKVYGLTVFTSDDRINDVNINEEVIFRGGYINVYEGLISLEGVETWEVLNSKEPIPPVELTVKELMANPADYLNVYVKLKNAAVCESYTYWGTDYTPVADEEDFVYGDPMVDATVIDLRNPPSGLVYGGVYNISGVVLVTNDYYDIGVNSTDDYEEISLPDVSDTDVTDTDTTSPITIKEALELLASSGEQEVTVTGQVVYKYNNTSITLESVIDGEVYAILVHETSSSSTIDSYELGDVVNVTGTVTLYTDNIPEIDNVTAVEVVSSEAEQIAPIEATVAEINANPENYYNKYIVIKNAEVLTNTGNYSNISDNSAEADAGTITIYKPAAESVVGGVYNIECVVSEYNGAVQLRVCCIYDYEVVSLPDTSDTDTTTETDTTTDTATESDVEKDPATYIAVSTLEDILNVNIVIVGSGYALDSCQQGETKYGHIQSTINYEAGSDYDEIVSVPTTAIWQIVSYNGAYYLANVSDRTFYQSNSAKTTTSDIPASPIQIEVGENGTFTIREASTQRYLSAYFASEDVTFRWYQSGNEQFYPTMTIYADVESSVIDFLPQETDTDTATETDTTTETDTSTDDTSSDTSDTDAVDARTFAQVNVTSIDDIVGKDIVLSNQNKAVSALDGSYLSSAAVTPSEENKISEVSTSSVWTIVKEGEAYYLVNKANNGYFYNSEKTYSNYTADPQFAISVEVNEDGTINLVDVTSGRYLSYFESTAQSSLGVVTFRWYLSTQTNLLPNFTVFAAVEP